VLVVDVVVVGGSVVPEGGESLLQLQGVWYSGASFELMPGMQEFLHCA